MADPAQPENVRGHCLCGAIRFELSGPPRFVAHCSCGNCRRAHGAGAVTFGGWKESALSIVAGDEQLVRYRTETEALRSFCGTCGTTMFYAGERWPGEVHVALGVLEDGYEARPKAHVYADRAPTWMPACGDVPRYGGAGGSEPL